MATNKLIEYRKGFPWEVKSLVPEAPTTPELGPTRERAAEIRRREEINNMEGGYWAPDSDEMRWGNGSSGSWNEGTMPEYNAMGLPYEGGGGTDWWEVGRKVRTPAFVGEGQSLEEERRKFNEEWTRRQQEAEREKFIASQSDEEIRKRKISQINKGQLDSEFKKQSYDQLNSRLDQAREQGDKEMFNALRSRFIELAENDEKFAERMRREAGETPSRGQQAPPRDTGISATLEIPEGTGRRYVDFSEKVRNNPDVYREAVNEQALSRYRSEMTENADVQKKVKRLKDLKSIEDNLIGATEKDKVAELKKVQKEATKLEGELYGKDGKEGILNPTVGNKKFDKYRKEVLGDMEKKYKENREAAFEGAKEAVRGRLGEDMEITRGLYGEDRTGVNVDYKPSNTAPTGASWYDPQRHAAAQEYYRKQNEAQQERLDEINSTGVYGGRTAAGSEQMLREKGLSTPLRRQQLADQRARYEEMQAQEAAQAAAQAQARPTRSEQLARDKFKYKQAQDARDARAEAQEMMNASAEKRNSYIKEVTNPNNLGGAVGAYRWLAERRQDSASLEKTANYIAGAIEQLPRLEAVTLGKQGPEMFKGEKWYDDRSGSETQAVRQRQKELESKVAKSQTQLARELRKEYNNAPA